MPLSNASKAVKNIRKITRTMELIATARFKKAMDRATLAAAYTSKIAELAADLAQSAADFSHPLMEVRERGEVGRAAGADVKPRIVRRINSGGAVNWRCKKCARPKRKVSTCSSKFRANAASTFCGFRS